MPTTGTSISTNQRLCDLIAVSTGATAVIEPRADHPSDEPVITVRHNNRPDAWLNITTPAGVGLPLYEYNDTHHGVRIIWQSIDDRGDWYRGRYADITTARTLVIAHHLIAVITEWATNHTGTPNPGDTVRVTGPDVAMSGYGGQAIGEATLDCITHRGHAMVSYACTEPREPFATCGPNTKVMVTTVSLDRLILVRRGSIDADITADMDGTLHQL